ncbi:MAG: DNA gyrase/topoisomerase IV subunit A, partial [Eudoraea sp.]|nr:DNA gyrase/topoisomerase IV subunit A [Eudoraea sp.]
MEDNDEVNEVHEEDHGNDQEALTRVTGMYKDWFLDYASYVILERAVPAIEDGFKPVQRRIMHALKELDDGRYNKVANVVGHTMQYHPHGDASIADAMVQIGQKDLLIDTQGNWGNILTGDSAAASRYIEARLSKFALDVVFSPKITEWQSSYDGRKKEPVNLPVKFPLLLAQGAEGIAVGLSTKILPHNFNEIIDGSIKHLKGQRFNLFPDFPTAGIIDVTNYNDGLRGGKVRVRAKISQFDKNTLVINEIPYGTNTSSLIDSILKANDKGKIKIKKIEDNTAAQVEILIHLPGGISPDKTIDALYAFTSCESSISPLGCIIEDNKPLFIGVTEMLRRSTDNTVEMLKAELEIQLSELQEQWHFASLERIFIENRIYRDIEEEETWEGVISAIDKGLKPHIKHLKRDVTEEDIVRLTEIRIKRISKFDLDKAQQYIDSLEDKIAQTKDHLTNLIDFAIAYFKELKSKYGKGRERKSEIRIFDDIIATKVVIRNTKLYVNREEGFI